MTIVTTSECVGGMAALMAHEVPLKPIRPVVYEMPNLTRSLHSQLLPQCAGVVT